MKKLSLASLSLAALGIISTLAACTAAQNNSGVETTAASAAPIVKTSKVSAAVNFSSDFDGILKAGETKTIRMTLTDNYPSGTLTVTVLPNDALSVFPDNAPFVFSMAGDAPHGFDLTVSALRDGQHYLNFNGIAEFGNGQVARVSHAISVRSGVALEKTAPLSSDSKNSAPSTGGVVVMDAEEEIIQK